MIGAEILIEPGQNPEDVEHWFKLLKENGFTITRLRMFEDYMKDTDGNWDFSLFDHAFKAGDKYGIKILGNLFPATSFDDIGGFKFPRDEKHWNEIRKYIEKTIIHFKDYKSLFGWVPVNEPGAPLPWHQEYTKEKFEEWKATTPLGTGTNGIRHFSFDKEKFVPLFWCLNPRSSGVEAGEWAMLDFHNRPTERFTTAAKIAKVINDNEKLFSTTKYMNPNIHILYIKESMWVEEKLSRYISDKQNDARKKGGVIKSALGYFEVLSQCGYNLNFGDINDFDFDKDDYSDNVIILSHQIAVPLKHQSNLDNFVRKGGTLIVDGLTAFYDENAISLMNSNFPLKGLFGGDVTEFKHIDKLFDLDVSDRKVKAHSWRGTITPGSGKVISYNNDQPTGLVNNYGKGKVIWIPSPLGLGAKISKEYEPLFSIFEQEFNNTGTFRFKRLYDGTLMKNIKTPEGLISVLINKNKEIQTIELAGFDDYRPQRILFQDNVGKIISRNKVAIYPEETIVIDWRKKQIGLQPNKN
jgi:beta-galactosidase